MAMEASAEETKAVLPDVAVFTRFKEEGNLHFKSKRYSDGEYNKAAEAYLAALQADPASAIVYANLSLVNYKLENYGFAQTSKR